MIDLYKQSTLGQFEATLAMLKQCLDRCPDELWQSTVAEMTVQQIAYHTLFFVDFYLTTSEHAFSLRELHQDGGDEREDGICAGLGKSSALEYLGICLEKLRSTIASETYESLRGPSGFSWLTFTRAEMHIYNLRHVQHHTGQLSSHLRRLVPEYRGHQNLRWVRTGWRD